MPISAADVIDSAFRHTKEQLLRPFRLGQWARLAVVGLLAGELGSAGGCNFNYPLNSPHRGSHQLLPGNWPAQLTDHPALFAGLVAAIFVVAVGLTVLFTYVSSVMRFILFDSIVVRECHIRRGWVRRKQAGLRLFWWRIGLMLATLAALLIVIGIPVACAGALGWLTHGRDHVLGLVIGAVILLLFFLALVLFSAVIQVMTKDFVVPQMALENSSAMEGWRRLWLQLKADKGSYAGYLGMKIVLSLGAAIIVLIVSLTAILVLLIPIGGVGVLVGLSAKAAGWTWNFYSISATVISVCAVLAILIFALSLISVPVIVFFPAYAIYFFAPRYPPLAALLWPQSSIPVEPAQS